MFLERLYDTDLVQTSCRIGFRKIGGRLIVRPVRDVRAYLTEAAAQNGRVTYVTATHRHADDPSGRRERATAPLRHGRTFPVTHGRSNPC